MVTVVFTVSHFFSTYQNGPSKLMNVGCALEPLDKTKSEESLVSVSSAQKSLQKPLQVLLRSATHAASSSPPSFPSLRKSITQSISRASRGEKV